MKITSAKWIKKLSLFFPLEVLDRWAIFPVNSFFKDSKYSIGLAFLKTVDHRVPPKGEERPNQSLNGEMVFKANR